MTEEDLVYTAMRVSAQAPVIAGLACPRCDGMGRRAYGSTATWRHGVGGQQVTEDVCDLCWGSARRDRTYANLRKLLSSQAAPAPAARATVAKATPTPQSSDTE